MKKNKPLFKEPHRPAEILPLAALGQNDMEKDSFQNDMEKEKFSE